MPYSLMPPKPFASTFLSLMTAIILLAAWCAGAATAGAGTITPTGRYPLVDTGQTEFFDNERQISRPRPGQPFFGEDAAYTRNAPEYIDNRDGSVTDKVTGLMWEKGYVVASYEEAKERLKNFRLAGYSDWRIPDIKELYSLILFSGVEANGRQLSRPPAGAVPFLDIRYFDFKYASNGERAIDSQFLSSTLYQGVTRGGQKTVFGVNFADGRLQGYPVPDRRSGMGKKFTVRFVRGNPGYGKNDFRDNKNGTISDLATGLMWQRSDSRNALSWEEALAWAQQMNREKHLGYSDWRLPNAKELQSIVEYGRSPQRTSSAAIDPLFEVTPIRDEEGRPNYPFYWTSTTHKNIRGGDSAVYICFGESLGFFKPAFSPDRVRLHDVHGAGAQRSDPKTGDPAEFPQGRGPQGDVIRMHHFARLVRDIRR